MFSLAGITLPEVVEDTVNSISSTANPIALMILGASFEFSSVRDCRRNLIIVVLSRLVIVPGIVLTAAALMGIGNIEFVTLVGIFAAPCAISSFTMAQQMDSDGVLAGASVIFTSAFACITMFLWLFIFKTAGVF